MKWVIIKKEKKERREGFFGDFFANFGMATLLSYGVIYIILPLLGNSFFYPVKNFFVANILFSVFLCWRFFELGKNEFVMNRVGGKAFVKCATLFWLIYALAYVLYHFSAIYMPNRYYGNNLSGDGIYALALILGGQSQKSVIEQTLLFEPKHGYVHPSAPLPPAFIFALIASFILHALVFTLLAYVFYKSGTHERDVERLDVLNGTDIAYEKVKKWRFYKCFIPFVNYYPMYSWTYDYFVNPPPERKTRYFFRGVLLIAAGMAAIEILRYLFYLVCPVEWANAVVFYLSLHLVGVVISLVAYWDNKRYEDMENEWKKE